MTYFLVYVGQDKDFPASNNAKRYREYMTSLSIEIIMGDTTEHDAKARDNGARLAAWLLWKHGLTIDNLVTHTYWVNKSAGKTFSDVDTQCTNPISGKKWCPTYIFGSNVAATAKKNWLAFKAVVASYLAELSGSTPNSDPAHASSWAGTTADKKEGYCNVDIKVLKKGAKGEDVRAMQHLLIGNGFSCGDCGADGSFGGDTDKAVRAYQEASGLAVDGSCGPATWTKLLGQG